MHVLGSRAFSPVDDPYKRHVNKETAFFLYCTVELSPSIICMIRKNCKLRLFHSNITLFSCLAYILVDVFILYVFTFNVPRKIFWDEY